MEHAKNTDTPPAPASADEPWLSMAQLAERLGKKEWFVRKLVREGMPVVKLSERAQWFVWSECAAWLRQRSMAVAEMKKATHGLHAERWH